LLGPPFVCLERRDSPVLGQYFLGFAIGFATGVATVFAIPAYADIKEATYEIQAVCFDHLDPVFDDAVGGRVNKGATTNARFHIHTQWLVNDGVIQDRTDLLGKCAIVYSQWVKDANGAFHQNAYIPKGHTGIEFTREFSSPEEAIDNYFHGSDFETGSAMGCTDVGSTKGGRGNSGGDCDE
jgi:hypothetical protein